MPLGSPAVVLWPYASYIVTAYTLTVTAAVVPVALVTGYLVTPEYASFAITCFFASFAMFFLLLKARDLSVHFSVLAAVFAVFFAVGSYFSVNINEGAMALLGLAVLVSFIGLWELVDGLNYHLEGDWHRFKNPQTIYGLDITAVMLGAFGLATAFADPPLF